jgi:allantoate deiminase
MCRSSARRGPTARIVGADQTSPGLDLSPEAAFSLLEELAQITDEPPGLTRTFLSPALDRAKSLVAGWMLRAGLEVFEDQAGNLICRLDCGDPAAGTVACGSHLDTVRNAGWFDGAMGVVTALVAVAAVAKSGVRLPFHLEVVGFSDEEGVRFQSTYLGSRFYAGTLGTVERAARDADGISVDEAIASHQPRFALPPARRLLGYVEAHIEQGPVLEKAGLALGVVTSIAGQTRARVFLEGKAGHAGTTPMNLRQDALAGAAEGIALVEKLAASADGLVATVGDLRIESAASNVIPGRVNYTLDIRDADDRKRLDFCAKVFGEIETRAVARGLAVRIENPLKAPATPCAPRLTDALEAVVCKVQSSCPRLVSGAGHDAVALAEVAEVAMLFVRCREGLSHHPDEYATPADISLAARVLTDFLTHYPIS